MSNTVSSQVLDLEEETPADCKDILVQEQSLGEPTHPIKHFLKQLRNKTIPLKQNANSHEVVLVKGGITVSF